MNLRGQVLGQWSENLMTFLIFMKLNKQLK